MRSHLQLLIRDAKRISDSLAKSHPTDAPWSTLTSILDSYEERIADHWPLSENEKETCRLGWFSVKHIDEAGFTALHEVLCEVAYIMRHGEEL